MLKSKYDDLDPYFTKETKTKDILELMQPKTKSKPNLKNDEWFDMKTQRLTTQEEKDVYKIMNRDIYFENGMEKVEVGDVFQIGTFVKQKRKR